MFPWIQLILTTQISTERIFWEIYAACLRFPTYNLVIIYVVT